MVNYTIFLFPSNFFADPRSGCSEERGYLGGCITKELTFIFQETAPSKARTIRRQEQILANSPESL